MRTMLCWGISTNKDLMEDAGVMSKYPDAANYTTWANKLWYVKQAKNNDRLDIKWYNRKYQVDLEDAVKRVRTYIYKGTSYTNCVKATDAATGAVTYKFNNDSSSDKYLTEFTINKGEASGVTRKDVYQASDYATRLYRGYSNGALTGSGIVPYLIPINITTLNASSVLNNDGYGFDATNMGEGVNVEVGTINTENY